MLSYTLSETLAQPTAKMETTSDLEIPCLYSLPDFLAKSLETVTECPTLFK